MNSDGLTDKHWKSASFALYGSFAQGWPEEVGEPKEILKFLDHHIGLQGTGEDHGSTINVALEAILLLPLIEGIDPLTLECVRAFNWTSPSLVKGILSMMQPPNPPELRRHASALVALVSDKWFDCSAHVMDPEEMQEFCEHIAIFMDDTYHNQYIKEDAVTILFGMLRSPDWRNHIVPRSWSVLAYCPLVEELDSAKWCLQNALQLLKFTEGLREGSKWWYWTLWFHYDKLDSTIRRVVRARAEDMVRNDGLSDLNLYLSLIQEDIKKIRQDMDELPDDEKETSHHRKMKARSIALEGNYKQLDQIMKGRRRR